MPISRTTLAAQTSPNCNDVIKAADAALQQKDSQITIRNTMIQQQADEISRQTKVIQDQDRSMNAFYNNKYLWAVLGAVTAAYLVRK